jgi:hypothetical protein
MDNGLIFPYPLVCANAESSDAKTPNPGVSLRVGVGSSGRSEGVVGERWGDAGG